MSSKCMRCGSEENFYITPIGTIRHTLYCKECAKITKITDEDENIN